MVLLYIMNLEEYYRNTVSANDAQTGGWATFYYGVFSKVINENNFKNIAEVGTGYGTHAKEILRNTNIDKFYLIDPCKFYANDGFANDIMNCKAKVPNNNFNELHELIKNELSPWNSKTIFLRKESLNVTNEEIPDGSLDAVFVDGDHSYEAVIEDLKFWIKKVRPGGQLLGDDYWVDGVRKAVHEFEEYSGKKADFLMRPGTDYKIFRFHV